MAECKGQSCHTGEVKRMEPKKLNFLIKAGYDVLPRPVNLHAWGLTTSDQCRACRKTANLKHILTGWEYALRSYTWRYNEVPEIFVETAKLCCETANKALQFRRCPWCNCYRRWKWTRRPEFKSWMRLIAFHIALIPLGKVWIQLFSQQLWVNSRTD